MFVIKRLLFFNFQLTIVLLLSWSIVSVFASYSLPVSSSPRVAIPQATYEGLRQYLNGKEIEVFLGIPYALPPVGSLRFRKPVAIRNPMGYLRATHLPPQCPRWSDPLITLPWISNRTMSEDCLYLNIWSPAKQYGKKLPVMVYIYGYETSSIDLEVNNGLALAAFGDVIVVTINWRTGILGNYYGGSEYAPGNLAGHDIILSLQWIQEFIDYFGGDPTKVTLFGQGRGAQWISIFNYSPLTSGLFTRSIIQSAAPQIINFQEQALDIGKQIASAAGCLRYNIIDNECMRRIPLKELLLLRGDLVTATDDDLYPFYDNVIINSSIIESFTNSSKKLNSDELIRGTNLDEGAILLYHDAPHVFQRGVHTVLNRTGAIHILNRVLPRRIGKIPHDDFMRIVNYYFGAIDEHDYKLLETALIAAVSATVTCPDALFSGIDARTNPVYRYYFTQDTEYNPYGGWHLSTNFQEMQYIFGMPLLHPEYYTKHEQQFSLEIIGLWASFAYSGKPFYRGIDWPLSNGKNRKYLSLNAKHTDIGHGPMAKDCDFWATVRYPLNPLFKDVN